MWLPQDFLAIKDNYNFNPLAKKHKMKLIYNGNTIWGVTASILYDIFITYNYLIIEEV